VLEFTGERIVPGAKDCEPNFAKKMYQEHIARYLFASQFVRGREVLDVGCGVGYGSLLLARDGAKKVLAFDISAEAIEYAKTHYPHKAITYSQLDAESFKRHKKFDVIVCFELIEHVEHQEQVIKNIYGHLKEDGLLIISTPRRLAERRSAFHTTEFSFEDFHRLLTKYFKHCDYFFENNHLISYITNAVPKTGSDTTTEILEDVFNLNKCDYFICIASKSLMNIEKIRNVMVVNDESYVKLLEKDTAILHEVEVSLRDAIKDKDSQIERLEADNVTMHEVEVSLRDAIKDKDSQIERLEADNVTMHEVEVSLRDAIKDKDSQIERLEADNVTMHEVEVSLRDAIKDKDSQIERLESTLSGIYHSHSWILISAFRALVDKLLPLETRRRRIAGLIFNKLWYLLPISREKPQKKQGRSSYTRASNLFSKTFDYYRKHGLRKTVSRVYIELTRKKLTNNIISLYSPEFYAPLTSKTATTKVKKVSFLIGCLEGESKRYRVYNIVEGLTGRGIECRVFYDINVDKLEPVVNCDLLILFRAGMSPNLDTIVRRFRELDIPVVSDVDDLVFEPESVCHVDEIKSWSDGLRDEYMNGVKRYKQTLERCDFATCTTEFLANRIRASGKKCFVIPNTINKVQYELAEAICKKSGKKDKKIRIGYFSGTSTHDRDFLEAAEALVEILQRHKNVELHIIGLLHLPSELSKLGARIVRKSFMPYLEMLRYLSRMDINTAPLEQGNPFNEGKSELKIFEPALVSVPTIASKIDSYSKCISDGENGFLAGSKKEWIEKLSLLIENEELRANMGINAKHDFVNRFYMENVIDDVLKVYDEIVDTYHQRGIDLNHIDIGWVIPEPFAGSGGHRNIFRAVKKLSEYGHKLTMYFTGDADIETIKHIVNNNFYDIRHVKFIKYDGHLGYHDVCFATHWTTVYPMMQHKDKIRYPFYFVQDYEPMFAPMSSEYILAENTYRMGLTCITSGPWPTRILKNKFNVEAHFFRFPVDKTVYNTDIKRTKTKRNIIFFARPEMPRRCYELGIMALKLVKEKLPDVEIILFGSDKIDGKSVPFEHTNLGLIRDINELAKLYRNADLGIAFSTTNPSLVPYEMMACGLAVADIRLEDSVVNYGNEDNVYLLNPVPEVMAQEMVEIMNNDEERQRKALNGYNFVQTFPDEDGMARRIEELIKRKIN
jgi:ubiquinone biosynthesis O-methyltransferase